MNFFLAKGAEDACAGSEADQAAAILDLYPLQSTAKSLVWGAKTHSWEE